MLCPEAKHINSPEDWLIPRKRWQRLDMTEELLTGALNPNTIKVGVLLIGAHLVLSGQ